ncbi:MAG: hypothetical protein IT364_17150, partial [Candidatus Hydrogenedentes bacterium]|nr:hypothetical protein [Candidatus Hydrogenedentota bacterium]
MTKRHTVGYIVLTATWLLVVAWQLLEHDRVYRMARTALVNRANDFSIALGVVLRAQGRFGLIPEEHIKAALDELAKTTETESVVLLNAAGEVTASAGEPAPKEVLPLLTTREHWEENTATFVNLVALGPGAEGPGPEGQPVIVSMQEGKSRDRNWPEPGPPKPPPPGVPDFLWENFSDAETRSVLDPMMNGQPLTEDQVKQILALPIMSELDTERRETVRRTLVGRPLEQETLFDALFLARDRRPHDHPPKRPPWMDEQSFEQIVRERGVHWFLVTMSTASVKAEMSRDRTVRGSFVLASLLACLALAVAWRAVDRSANLRVRLVREEELTTHLRELNMAAAGLVHETKNPLNLIRGMAQMIGRGSEPSASTRDTALKITEEVDRVTGRINQFLDYSRPVEPRKDAVDFLDLANRVFDILASDREDKAVKFQATGPRLILEADREMLRQVLFNLLINAVEAVPAEGSIEVHLIKAGPGRAAFEVRDNGPGVPPGIESEVFRPYFTTSKNGTGLGLAIVRQIALAHQWDIEYVREASTGAIFRVGGIALAHET